MDVWRFTAVGPAWTIPVFAVATIVLGAWGWISYGRRLDEALYRSIALFSIANQVYRDAPGSTDWRFLVGRWTGLFAEFARPCWRSAPCCTSGACSCSPSCCASTWW